MILELEKQVTDIEISKQLKKLGLRQDTQFFHVDYKDYDGVDKTTLSIFSNFDSHYSEEDNDYKDVEVIDSFSAYTVHELLEIMPDFLEDDEDRYAINVSRFIDDSVGYMDFHASFYKGAYSDRVSLPDALADVLISLITGDELDVKELNKERG
jgi:hypothetical protein